MRRPLLGRNWLLKLLFLTSCGYQWHHADATRPTLTVPFVAGDEEGILTAEVISALSSSGLVDVIHQGGEYCLRIAIQSGGNDNIGFRRDPQKVDGKVRRNLLAIEARRSLAIEATLYRGEELISGPFLLAAAVDYDFVDGDSIQDLTFINPAGQLVTVLPFSLGQLEPLESAQDAATKPLYRQLAQKIVDALAGESFIRTGSLDGNNLGTRLFHYEKHSESLDKWE
jgi:hypothetical protein